MIVINDKYYTRKYQYGGSSIFSSIFNAASKATAKKLAAETAKKIAANTAQKLANKASTALSDKIIETGKKLVSRKKKSPPPILPTQQSNESPQSNNEANERLNRILSTITDPTPNINSVIDGSSIPTLQDYVKRGHGIKTLN